MLLRETTPERLVILNDPDGGDGSVDELKVSNSSESSV